jgi:hypothetical protein
MGRKWNEGGRYRSCLNCHGDGWNFDFVKKLDEIKPDFVVYNAF